MSVERGQIWERQSGPPIRVKVVEDPAHGLVGCRMYRASGSSFAGIRHMPVSLLDGKHFALVEASS